MATTDYAGIVEPLPQTLAPKSKGEMYESIAFNFCKAATIILFTGPYALPVASGAAAVLYVLAHVHGKRDSRCVLRSPLLIAAFWGAICLAWIGVRVWRHMGPA